MKANKNLMLGAAVATIFAAAAIPANAADAILEPPAPPAAPMEVAPVATWAGPYAGAAVGYGFNGEVSADGIGGDVDTDGFVGDVFGGWNWQSGTFVYGVEGDVGYNGMEGDEAGVDVEGGVEGSLRARLGVAATDNILIYGTAGGAGARQEVTALGDSDTQTLWGWTAGAGTDVKLTDRSFARLEYRYTDLGDETYDLGGSSFDVDSSSHRVMVGFGMQF